MVDFGALSTPYAPRPGYPFGGGLSVIMLHGVYVCFKFNLYPRRVRVMRVNGARTEETGVARDNNTSGTMRSQTHCT